MLINPLNYLFFSKSKFNRVENVYRSLPLLQGPKEPCRPLYYKQLSESYICKYSEGVEHLDV